MKLSTLLLLALASVAAARAKAETLIVETARPALFDLAPCSESYTVGSIDSPLALRYRAGDTITLTAPDAKSATPVSDAAATGAHSWTPDSGGVWKAANSSEGEVSFLVWHSLFGLGGAGTESNPAEVVDADDFAATLVLADSIQGFVFATDGCDVDAFSLPDGYGVVALGGGAYKIVAAAEGFICEGPAVAFPLDTRRSGPDRKVRKGESIPAIAYSGDDWRLANSTASCSLSFMAPSGIGTSSEFTGSGAYMHEFDETGVWTVTLAGENATTLVAHINLVKDGMAIVVR